MTHMGALAVQTERRGIQADRGATDRRAAANNHEHE
jgi:hypothetical protein